MVRFGISKNPNNSFFDEIKQSLILDSFGPLFVGTKTPKINPNLPFVVINLVLNFIDFY